MVILRIHDKVAAVYGPTFSGDNGPGAIRSFQEAINNPESPYHKWPADFDLIQVGHYETNSPEIFPDVPTVTLVTGQNIASALATQDAEQDLAAATQKAAASNLAPIRN